MRYGRRTSPSRHAYDFPLRGKQVPIGGNQDKDTGTWGNRVGGVIVPQVGDKWSARVTVPDITVRRRRVFCNVECEGRELYSIVVRRYGVQLTRF